MILRYKCPPSYKHVEDTPLWRTATTAFMECIKDGISIVETLEKGSASSKLFANMAERGVLYHPHSPVYLLSFRYSRYTIP